MPLFFLYIVIGCTSDNPKETTPISNDKKEDSPSASTPTKPLPQAINGFVATQMDITIEDNSKTDEEIQKEEEKGKKPEVADEPEEGEDGVDPPEDDGTIEPDEGSREHFTYAVEIQKTEVTQKQFTDLMGWNPSFFGGCGLKCMQNSTTNINAIEDVIQEDNGGILNAECFDVSTVSEQDCGPNCPVESVSWYDAIAYANALSIKESRTPCFIFTEVVCTDGTKVGTSTEKCMNDTQKGILSATVTNTVKENIFLCTGYRLLTQKEWIFATLGEEKGPLYSSTNNNGTLQNRGCSLDPNLDKIAWYGANSKGKPHPVGQKAPNNIGLHDMMGNIGEWVYDEVNRPDLSDDFVDEETGFDSLNEEEKKARGIEKNLFATKDRLQLGGSWLEYGAYCEANNFTSMPPSDRDASSGFRVIRTTITP